MRGEIYTIVMSEISVLVNTMLRAIQRSYNYLAPETAVAIIHKGVLSLTGVLTGSKLLPELSDWAISIGNVAQRRQRQNLSSYGAIEERKMIKTETKLLLERLIKCNRVALILPDALCHEYAEILRVRNNLKYAFVGKQSPSPEIEWMFRLIGPVPPHVPERISKAHESDLWSRWLSLEKRSNSASDNLDPVAARMNGNVVVLFVAWIAGLIFSMASFCIESL